jgi:hypothetical protein
MKLSKNIVDYIRNAIKVAKLVGIESIAFEPGIVRAMDDNKTVVICHSNNVPTFEFSGIGIGRLDLFTSRYGLVDGRDQLIVEAELDTKSGTNQISQLIFKAKNIKVEYRCANSTTIRAPKSIKDVMTYEFVLNADGVDTLIKAQNAMGVEYVTVISDKTSGMRFELVDINRDIFVHEFSAQAVNIETKTKSEFVHRYPLKTLTALFKQDATQRIEVGERGFMKLVVYGLDVFVLPSI